MLRRVRQALGELLDEAGGNQAAVARRLGLTQPAISQTLSSTTKLPGTATLTALAATGYNGHWLLTGQGEPRAPLNGTPEAIYRLGIAEGLRRGGRGLEELAAATERESAEGAAALLALAERVRAFVEAAERQPPPRTAAPRKSG